MMDPTSSCDAPSFAIRPSVISKISRTAWSMCSMREPTLDLHAAFQALASNETVADPLMGEAGPHESRAQSHLDDTGIVRMRMEVRVTAITSQDASRLVGVREHRSRYRRRCWCARVLCDHATLTVTGDLVLLDEVLNGLTESQLRRRH